MARYIDADLLESQMMLFRYPYKDSVEFNKQYRATDVYMNILEMIKIQPTADLVEVKQGRWDVDSDNLPICSECGENALQRVFIKIPHRILDVRMVMSNYCPNCGAKLHQDTTRTTTSGADMRGEV